MTFHFWSFMAGAVVHSLVQWLILLPSFRRHWLVMALLNRARMYQKRSEILSQEGKEEQAWAALHESRLLLEQVEKIQPKILK